ncbi:hypothetical protein CU097_013041 [Rhizopus azygosporus]|uniref:Uncharacterized protein n=1 Tax=Rhizopus azygosporus TaxID=86630 RepID=A0A367KA08_RHIAZ|nr:hypothetical protein CU097_013041 [Rhizopus azygosporus]
MIRYILSNQTFLLIQDFLQSKASKQVVSETIRSLVKKATSLFHDKLSIIRLYYLINSFISTGAGEQTSHLCKNENL